MKVLVADDDAVYRDVLTDSLRSWGYEPTAVADGVAALAALSELDAPRLAVLDWLMPRLDGPTVCRLVRAQQDAPPVYLILLTVRRTPEDVVAGLDSGANDFVTKPFEP